MYLQSIIYNKNLSLMLYNPVSKKRFETLQQYPNNVNFDNVAGMF